MLRSMDPQLVRALVSFNSVFIFLFHLFKILRGVEILFVMASQQHFRGELLIIEEKYKDK